MNKKRKNIDMEEDKKVAIKDKITLNKSQKGDFIRFSLYI